jgi:hypothetical protein
MQIEIWSLQVSQNLIQRLQTCLNVEYLNLRPSMSHEASMDVEKLADKFLERGENLRLDRTSR